MRTIGGGELFALLGPLSLAVIAVALLFLWTKPHIDRQRSDADPKVRRAAALRCRMMQGYVAVGLLAMIVLFVGLARS